MRKHFALSIPILCTLLGGCAAAIEDDVGTVHERLLGGMNLYFGNFHAHTKYSDGSNTPAEGYAWAREQQAMRFYVITDHAELLSNSEWKDVGAQADAHNVDGAFVALRGFEYTNYFSGHVNVFDTSSQHSFWNDITLGGFYTWLDSANGIGQFNHPGDPSDFSGFSFGGRAADNMAMLEVGNGDTTIASGTYVDHFHKALSKGWKVAPTSNLDNHSLSDAGRRTVVVANALTRTEVLGAMRARRLYATDDLNVQIAFQLNGQWMGSTVAGSTGPYTFAVTVIDDEAISKLELWSKGAVVATLTPTAGSASATWQPTLKVNADTYAYLKVTEADGQVAMTAPIWIDVP